MRNGRDWEDANLPSKVLRNVQALINAPFGTDLTIEDIAVRVIQLKGRYVAFKKVLHTTGATWRMEDKVVLTEDSTWKCIFKVRCGEYFILSLDINISHIYHHI